jgi:hypothetical protein
MPDENDTDLTRSMPSFRYAAQKTHWYGQDDTSLAEHLKRKARMALPASREPTTRVNPNTTHAPFTKYIPEAEMPNSR